MIITDNNEIASATPKYPHIMRDDSSDTIISMFLDIKDARRELSLARRVVAKAEQRLKSLEEDYNRLAPMFNITFKTKEVEEIKNTTYIGINNKEDARNL